MSSFFKKRLLKRYSNDHVELSKVCFFFDKSKFFNALDLLKIDPYGLST